MPRSNVHFIAGLPRSGSTLLSAILRQNPRFTAGVTSPVSSLWGAAIPKMSGATEFATFFDDAKRLRILRGIFSGYYGEANASGVIFDTNRHWTARAPLIGKVYPNSRIICCVRDVGWVIDSVERILRSNPLQTSRVFAFKPGTSVYGRVEALMNSDSGLVGSAWTAMREAWFGEHASRLVVLDYDRLVREPKASIVRLYEILEEPEFDHDFDHLGYDEPDYDADLGMPGLHKIRDRVGFTERAMCIPPDIAAQHADSNFWRRPEYQGRGAVVV